ncbi:MAG TPA: hypothetical protein VFF32_14640 [Dermatophilaceae bacterium]|nr:hypothetical protein [Dermatophilaceae bacterium]
MNSVRILLAASLATGAIVLSAAGASAAAPPEPTFGQHVSQCAKAMDGFSGAHNPSMMANQEGLGMTTCLMP